MRRLLVGLFVVMLVVNPTTATAATYPSAEAACGQTSGGELLVGILPGSSNPSAGQVLDGETALYPGTTFKVALCKDGELKPTRGSEWSLQSSPGLKVLNETDATVTVRVTGEQTEIDVPGLVSGKQNLGGVSVVVRQAPTAESELGNGTITFANTKAAQSYEATEQQYLAALSNYTDATARLKESATAVESGDAKPENVNETVAAVTDGRNLTTKRADELERQLYDISWQSGGSTTALKALETAQSEEQKADAEAKRAMKQYLAALETAESNAQTTVFLNLGGAALVGLIAGALPGWKLTASKLEDIRFDRQVNSNVSYSLGVLARAAGLAVLALGLTVGGLVALGGLSALGGLLL